MSSPQLTEIIDALERTPQLISPLLRNISAEQMRLRNDAGEFSALETICHLRDLELEGYGQRITRILSEDHPELPDFDGARLAMERGYNNQDPQAAMGEFFQARQQNVVSLRDLNSEQLARAGVLEGVGEVTIERLAEMMWEHDQGHLSELAIISRRAERS